MGLKFNPKQSEGWKLLASPKKTRILFDVAQNFFSPFRIVQTTDHNGGPIIKNNREFALLETADAGRQVADKIGFERIAPQ